MFENIKQDIKAFEYHHGKGFFAKLYYPMFMATIFIRLQCYIFRFRALRPISYLLVRLNDLIFGIWVGPRVRIGPGLFLGHSRGLVINPDTVIGENCIILQRVTLGGPNIRIGNNVFIGAGAQIISRRHKSTGVTVGDNAKIAAGAVVICDVCEGATVAGNPAQSVNANSSKNS